MKFGKLTVGLAAAGATGLIAWLLWRKSHGASPPLITGNPYEWAQYTPSGLMPATDSCGAGFIPFKQADGSLRCDPVKIEILSISPTHDLPKKCTVDANCPPGLVCIDGTCQSESNWG